MSHGSTEQGAWSTWSETYLTSVLCTLFVSFSDKKSKFIETLARNAILRALKNKKNKTNRLK